MSSKRGGALGVIGATAAAVAGGTYFFGDRGVPEVSETLENETHSERADKQATARTASAEEVPPGKVIFCHPVVLPDGCFPADALAAEGEALFGEGVLPSRPTTMIGLEETDEDMEVMGCDAFVRARSRGYSAASGAGFRREAQMARACGLLVFAQEAQAVASPPLDPDWMMDLPRGDLPGLGNSFGDDAVYERISNEPIVWTLESDTLRGEFLHVATADFDGDGKAEHLIEWRVAAVGGSLRGIGYGLGELNPKSFRDVDPFQN
ncbi:hypothetical protein HK107_12580 [Parvularcula sp. ZS-1/3]|uniref:Uncharacterized protein n=1 Tax=Parvularcula mediterranea TaxID=2732508 RepID=A0A7Y3RN71_9PROT|nr:hypothetical protein [Parvularcula mediterranea]NNU17159.1 hypothetical protein [Parvularcula mediterranea]